MSGTPLLDRADEMQWEYRRKNNVRGRSGLAFLVGPRTWSRVRVEASGLTLAFTPMPGEQRIHGYPAYVDYTSGADVLEFMEEARIPERLKR